MLSLLASRVAPVDDAVWHIIASQPTGTKAISSSQPIPEMALGDRSRGTRVSLHIACTQPAALRHDRVPGTPQAFDWAS